MGTSRQGKLSPSLRRAAGAWTIWLLIGVFFTSTMQAQSAASAADGPTGQNASDVRSPKYEISSGDLLEISVFGVPDYNQKLRVGGDGTIYVALIGTLPVAGLTVEAAQTTIEKRLVDGNYMVAPHVSVLVSETAVGVWIMGEVNKPGMYPIWAAQRLPEAISAAGGLTQLAGRTATITHRDGNEPPRTVKLPRDSGSSSADDASIRQGDTIYVSKAGIVYVVGEVLRPSGFTLGDENFTLLQAIAMAGGANSTASLDKTRLIRKGAKGTEDIPIPLKKILQAKADDVVLQANDIVFVPTSTTTAKRVARRTVDSIVQVTTGLAIYRLP